MGRPDRLPIDAIGLSTPSRVIDAIGLVPAAPSAIGLVKQVGDSVGTVFMATYNNPFGLAMTTDRGPQVIRLSTVAVAVGIVASVVYYCRDQLPSVASGVAAILHSVARLVDRVHSRPPERMLGIVADAGADEVVPVVPALVQEAEARVPEPDMHVPQPDMQTDAPVPEPDVQGDAPVPEADAQGDAPVPEADVQTDALVPEADVQGDAPVPEPDVQTDAPVPEPDVQTDALVPEPDVQGDALVPEAAAAAEVTVDALVEVTGATTPASSTPDKRTREDGAQMPRRSTRLKSRSAAADQQ
jgi:hypothetical protein